MAGHPNRAGCRPMRMEVRAGPHRPGEVRDSWSEDQMDRDLGEGLGHERLMSPAPFQGAKGGGDPTDPGLHPELGPGGPLGRGLRCIGLKGRRTTAQGETLGG